MQNACQNNWDGSRSTPPQPLEIEVSLFGPGYGECVVVHTGHGQWVVVDSCLDAQSKEPSAFIYLSKLGVELENQVKLIVATHWHDDHVRGLAAVVKSCLGAKFAFSSALCSREFLDLIGAMQMRPMMDTTGIKEFTEILSVLAQRGKNEMHGDPKIFAIADRLLWKRDSSTPGNDPECEIIALSPSDKAHARALESLRGLFPSENTTKKRIAQPSPNHNSVVLWIKIGGERILLGSDLQNDSDATGGWGVIVASKTRPPGKASAFKIPHHGSQNAHHPAVWNDMLEVNPRSILTPFVQGNVSLPAKEDIQRISALTRCAYITVPVEQSRKPMKPSGAVNKTINETVRFIRPVPFSTGQIRLRKALNSAVSSEWRVELFPPACQLKVPAVG